MRRTISSILFLTILISLAACSQQERKAKALGIDASTFPDYNDVTMPCNIAPPTFILTDESMLHDAIAIFEAGSTKHIVESDGERGFCISEADWHSLTSHATDISIRIQGTNPSGEWVEYNTQKIHISRDSIDNFLTYRLVEPGYEVWGEMGIYQRDLQTYEERAIITNDKTDGGCINCHSYCNYDAETMSLHMRKTCAGTYIRKDGTDTRLQPQPSLVYPSWHPTGKYIAYSQNDTKQLFHTTSRNRIEVFDYSSDIVVLNTETMQTFSCPQLTSGASFETFPSWSPDGRTLYFCSADSVAMPAQYDEACYSLCSIAFDPHTGTFDTKVDTLYNVKREGGSISFPRVSPDGRYLMFTHHAYGNFSIWHHEADLWMIDLQANGFTCPLDALNSSDTDSYHSWSSNGKWVIFSSRRIDGLYTRPFIAHFDGKGHFSKPFYLPQNRADHHQRLMKSYNIPEFTRNATREW